MDNKPYDALSKYLDELKEKGKIAQEKGICYLNGRIRCPKGEECAIQGAKATLSALEQKSMQNDSPFEEFTDLNSITPRYFICEKLLPKNVRNALKL